jgi:hypothetical protein
MDLQIVNPDPKYSTVTLIPPATLGYVHLAAKCAPRHVRGRSSAPHAGRPSSSAG